jgi:phosphatidylinositol-bisphosphatase
MSISDVCSTHVATGIRDRVGNKGGVGISIKVAGVKYLFVTAHFAAHQNGVLKRNADFHKIRDVIGSSLVDVPESPVDGLTETETSKGSADALDGYDFVFWCGDLNYRINGNRKAVDAVLKQKLWEVLLANDQLLLEKRAARIFAGFQEGTLGFPPTYKFDKNSDNYDTSAKSRIPAWTDRVLYRVKTPKLLKLVRYDSARMIRCSDHRPVFAHFFIRLNEGARVLAPKQLIERKQRDTAENVKTGPSKVCALM